MLKNLFSGDFPRSRVLTLMLLVTVGLIVATPFIFPGSRPIDTAAKICVFIVLVASYDLMLGYTGIVSFAHTMFFAIGAYGVAIAVKNFGPSWGAVLLGSLAALALTSVLALLIGLFSLRVRALFFAMITLAVSSAFALLASQLRSVTGGEDGITFSLPDPLRPSFRLFEGDFLGVAVNGRLITFYLIVIVTFLVFVALLRLVNSPFGRVLQAIRENEFRTEAIGYPTLVYRTLANVIGALGATVAGILLSLWLRYTGPNSTLDLAIMIDILLMTVIGGIGTMYGAVLGAALFLLVQNYLNTLMASASKATEGIPILPDLLHPDRWLLWLGLLFILSVYFFPKGIVGRLRAAASGGQKPGS